MMWQMQEQEQWRYTLLQKVMKYQDLDKYFYFKKFWEIIEHANIEQNVELFLKFAKKMCFFHTKGCG